MPGGLIFWKVIGRFLTLGGNSTQIGGLAGGKVTNFRNLNFQFFPELVFPRGKISACASFVTSLVKWLGAKTYTTLFVEKWRKSLKRRGRLRLRGFEKTFGGFWESARDLPFWETQLVYTQIFPPFFGGKF